METGTGLFLNAVYFVIHKTYMEETVPIMLTNLSFQY